MTVCLYLTFSNSARHTHLFQGIIASSVQLFFSWRVKVVTSNILAVMLIVICAFINMRESSSLLLQAHVIYFRRYSGVHRNLHCSWYHTSLH